jgi:hypothetical protein
MSSATATSVFDQTDGDDDLNRAIENGIWEGRGWKMPALRLFNADLID